MALTRRRFKDLAEKFVDDTFSDFTHSFTIESLTETQDGQGGYTTGWATFATIAGFVFPYKDNQKQLDEHIKNESVKLFKFEHVASIEGDMRILYDGNYYNIHGIQSAADKDIWITITAYKDEAQ